MATATCVLWLFLYATPMVPRLNQWSAFWEHHCPIEKSRVNSVVNFHRHLSYWQDKLSFLFLQVSWNKNMHSLKQTFNFKLEEWNCNAASACFCCRKLLLSLELGTHDFCLLASFVFKHICQYFNIIYHCPYLLDLPMFQLGVSKHPCCSHSLDWFKQVARLTSCHAGLPWWRESGLIAMRVDVQSFYLDVWWGRMIGDKNRTHYKHTYISCLSRELSSVKIFTWQCQRRRE